MTATAKLPSVRGFYILVAINRLHYVTSKQLTRLLFKSTTHTTTQMNLTQLTRDGYLRKDALPDKSIGAKQGLWSLTRKGKSYLMAHGEDVVSSDPHPEHKDAFLRHVLTTNDCIIAAELFCREQPEWLMGDVFHDLDRQRVKDTPVPDAWVGLRYGDRRLALWFEVDESGSHREQQWREKIGSVISYYASNRYTADYQGEKSLTVAVFCRQGQERVERLRAWTERLLAEQGREGWADVFRFTALDPGHISPQHFFTAPHWARIGKEASALIAL